jgi:hypothetical protein
MNELLQQAIERDPPMTLTKEESTALVSRTHIERIANTYVEKFHKNDWGETYPFFIRQAFMINSGKVGVYFTGQDWKQLLYAVPLRDLVTYEDFKHMAQIDIDRRRKEEEDKLNKEHQDAMAIIKRGYL